MNIEYTILNFIRGNLSNSIMDALMIGISFLGDGGWFWIVTSVVLALIPKTRKIGITACVALLINFLLCNLTLKPIFARVRPYDLIDNIELIVKHLVIIPFPRGIRRLLLPLLPLFLHMIKNMEYSPLH